MSRVKKNKEINFADIGANILREEEKSKPDKNKKNTKPAKQKKIIDAIKFKNMIKKSQPISIYRKIAFTFVALTIILATVVFYFSIVGVKITIIPNKERTISSFIATVMDKTSNSNAKGLNMAGMVEPTMVEIQQTFATTGKEVKSVNVVGKVTIYNNRTTSQPLIKTTRLSSPDGRIYRLQETVTVPARGKIENIQVYADTASKEMEIEPTKFIIPGLNKSAQELVYAQSFDSFNYQEIGDAIISEADLVKAKEVLKKALLEKAAVISDDKKYQVYDNIKYDIDDNAITYTTDAKAGDESADFVMAAKAQAAIVAFNTKDVVALAKLKIEESIANDKQLLSFDENNFTFTVDRYDLATGMADLKIEAVAQMILKDGADIINPERLAGLNRAQLDDYLSSLREVAGYEIKFTPNWLNKVPSLVDHIKVEIEK